MTASTFSTCIVMTAALLVVVFSPLSAAREDKKTKLTVHAPIKIPGTVLPPGEYMIQLVDSPSNNHIVRFTNSEGSQTIATVVAVPNRRMDPTGSTKFTFYETPSDSPPVLRAWFYPGDTYGQEFAYPESTAARIAKYSHRHVPALSDETGVDELPQAEINALSPRGGKSDLKSAWDANQEADRRMTAASTYVSTLETDESRLARKIRKELITLPYYTVWDYLSFQVQDDDTVTLVGKVHRPTLKTSAERVVGRLEEVHNVENKIEVLPTSPNDDRIRQAAYDAIYGHTSLQRYEMGATPQIHIIVDDGNVTLEGVVGNKGDKQVAGMEANSVAGVHSVENNLRIG